MKIIYNSLIPFRGYKAMMLFGVIFARKKFKPLSAVTVNHESIHAAQAKDCHGYFLYYCRYIWQWICHGYKGNPFEIEAKTHERDLNYLYNRKPEAWRDMM
ncbi:MULTISPECIES: hypothetical protein [Alistipes]|jgi:hypothetical protein|uniref:hypothetical protein n=1 Tax=Alistipes TaxID=239759 RepID=UPI00206C4D34|nr:hypothetical protein [Alistipes ihumii]DAX37762.1 MAG TPA: BovA [Caudoviricetes sp.]